jgi:hypothetical protein
MLSHRGYRRAFLSAGMEEELLPSGDPNDPFAADTTDPNNPGFRAPDPGFRDARPGGALPKLQGVSSLPIIEEPSMVEVEAVDSTSTFFRLDTEVRWSTARLCVAVSCSLVSHLSARDAGCTRRMKT